MSDTPRTQKAYTLSRDDTGAVTRMEPIWDEMQALERELNEARAALAAELAMPTHLLDVHAIADERDSLREINAELEEAGNELLNQWYRHASVADKVLAREAWEAALTKSMQTKQL